jgi:translation initiation factor IF-3
MIRIPQVRVVDEEGAQLGVMPTPQALEMAQERGYDLVEVAPMASPPVARFLDFGQYKYELTKREKEAKRKQRSVTFKEVRLKPKIGGGDFDTKVRRAIEFLEEGDRIKVAVQFRGRELTHPEIGRALLERFSDKIKDHGVIERAPLLEGKSMHITVASVHKPKQHEGPATAHTAGSPAPGGELPPPVPAPTAPAAPTAAAAATTPETPATPAAPAVEAEASTTTRTPPTDGAESPIAASPSEPAPAAEVASAPTASAKPAAPKPAAAKPKPRTRTKPVPTPAEASPPATTGE